MALQFGSRVRHRLTEPAQSELLAVQDVGQPGRCFPVGESARLPGQLDGRFEVTQMDAGARPQTEVDRRVLEGSRSGLARHSSNGWNGQPGFIGTSRPGSM